MRKSIYILSAIICTASIHGAIAQTKQICTRNSFLGVDEVANTCDNICKNNGFKKSQSWRCGSDIEKNCNNGAACVCNCAQPVIDDERGYNQRNRDEGTIDIPLGDKFKIQINP